MNRDAPSSVVCDCCKKLVSEYYVFVVDGKVQTDRCSYCMFNCMHGVCTL